MRYGAFHGPGRVAVMMAGILLLLSRPVVGSGHTKAPKTPLELGKAKAIEMCQACHMFPGAEQPGTVGPPFVAMKSRFPERQRLQEIIYDPHKAIKPETMMPPFGRNGLMDKDDIERVVDFLYTL